MARRTIFAGTIPTIIIKSSDSVEVEGWDSDQVQAETRSHGGLKVELRRDAEIGRARAAVGDRVLFDVPLNVPGVPGKSKTSEAIEVTMSGEGKVQVPRGSRVKVFAGKSVQASEIQGTTVIYAGGSVRVRNAHSLAHVFSGGSVDVECETVEGQEVRFEAAHDLRCYVRSLNSARVLVSDLGGTWEGVIGSGEITLRLKAGCDATLVTDQEVRAAPPSTILGQIERPAPL